MVGVEGRVRRVALTSSVLIAGAGIVLLGVLLVRSPGRSPHAALRAPRARAVRDPQPRVASPSTVVVPQQLPQWLARFDDSSQVVSVVADDYGLSAGELTVYARERGVWSQVFGPWQVHLGYNGFAPLGEKSEGDGRTPTGSFGFDFLFGTRSRPDVSMEYRQVTGPSIVWDDDPTSANYNRWVDAADADAGNAPEPLYTAAYDLAAVIAYNDERIPGDGSAIFLHVSTGSATAGCVSLPEEELVPLLEWLEPTRSPRIVMGTRAVVDQSLP